MIDRKFIDKIKKSLSKLEDKNLYSPEEIMDMEIILNINLKPSKDRLYRELRKIKRVNMGTDTFPRWFVLGKTLREYAEARYISKFK